MILEAKHYNSPESLNEELIDLGNGIIFIDDKGRKRPRNKPTVSKIPKEDQERYAEDLKILKDWAERSHKNAKNR